MDLKESIAHELTVVRDRSLSIVDPLPEAEQARQHSTLMSPMVWDLAHVGNYEDIWLLRGLGARGVGERYDDLYNAFLTPRAQRKALPMLGPSEARAYIAEVRGRVLDHLERTDLDPTQPLVRDGFVYGMVVQHEHQHDETLLATAQLMDDYSRFSTVATPAPRDGAIPSESEVLVEAGPFVMGTDQPWAYDNERAPHTVELDAFWIDVTPVTNRQYLAFIEDGAYDDPRHWDAAGWRWRQRSSASAPEFWSRDGAGSWSVRRFGRAQPLHPDEPVQHVCWYEADAFARWAGKRLPTEAEWEKAASWDPMTQTKRLFPWGDEDPGPSTANLGQTHYEPAVVGAYPDGVSPWRCHQMLGDVWEWTSSDLLPYPGFASFPYAEYTEVFFGSSYKVLRGGSWATHPHAIRTTFRNWDYPIRRQIFSGLRCARDA